MLDKSQVAQLLGATEIFAKLQSRHLDAIANACKVVRYEERARIVNQGESGQELFIIAAGQVSIINEEPTLGIEQPILTLGPGQSFGEASLLAEIDRSATARALSEVICVVLAKRSFESVLSQIPEVGLEISRYLAVRLHKQCQLTGFRFVAFQDLVFDQDLYGMFSAELLGRLKAIPLALKDGILTVALTRPNQASTIHALREAAPGLGIEPVACSWEDYEAFVSRYRTEAATPKLSDLTSSGSEIRLGTGGLLSAPLSSLIDFALSHEQPHLIVQPGVDGYEVVSPQEGGLKQLMEFENGQSALLTEQISATFLENDERPQVCSSTLLVGGQSVSMQLSYLPTLTGPRYSFRFLDPIGSIPSLLQLAPVEALRNVILSVFRQAGRQILLAGSHRSGRSTTVYSLVRALHEEEGLKNVVMLEHRPLGRLDGVSQVRVEKDWQQTLEAALLQMPDLLVVDEADRSTLQDLFSTSDCASSSLITFNTTSVLTDLTKFRDESGTAIPFENVGLLLQQVLVPKLCPHCRLEYEPSSTVRSQLQRSQLAEPGQKFFQAPGCPKCRGAGTAGRMAVIEAMSFTPVVREMVSAGRPEDAIRKSALSSGLLVPYSASAKVFLGQGQLGPTTALRYFGRV